MTDKARVLIIGEDNELPRSLTEAVQGLGLASCVCRLEEAVGRLKELPRLELAVLVLKETGLLQKGPGKELSEEMSKLSVNALLLADQAAGEISAYEGGMLSASLDESSEMLKGRLAMLTQLQPVLAEMARELKHLDMVNRPLNNYFTQVDEEMRLAARIQRDFLPQRLPEVDGVRFATVFRPASWVSGDIYDIVRLDEDHVGFYVADAVGHGMPAALLTMFIKRALVTKEISGHSYRLIEPGDALAQLNRDMVGEGLSNFQFATCCYAILNWRSLELRVASAGHPAPMRIDRNAVTTELDVTGSLLGVFEGQEYDTRTVQLQPGDKLLLYSDGVELAFVTEGSDEPLRFRQEFGDVAHMGAQDMCNKLRQIIEREEGSLHPRDDVTIVGVELDNNS